MGCGSSKEESVSDGASAPQGNRAVEFAADRKPGAPAPPAPRNAAAPGKGGRKMNNVFATPLDILGLKDGYSIPVHVKTNEETEFIKKVVLGNFIFEHLTRKEINRLVDAFEKTKIDKKGTEIIKQGDVGDYFYVIYDGAVEFVVNDSLVGKAESGASFGELALLYTSPRAATVRSTTDNAILYRVDQATFRYILQAQTKEAAGEKVDLLKLVSFLKDLDAGQINKLAAVMTPKKFPAGDYLMRKGDAADFFYILAEGSVTAKNVTVGEAKFEDLKMDKRGDYFGERALVTGEPRAADIVANTDVTAFAIDKATFENVLGNFNDLILRAQDKRELEGIKVISNSKFNESTLTSLVSVLEDKKFKVGELILKAGVAASPPALYLVRVGEVEITFADKTKRKIGVGGYFGDDQLLADVSLSKKLKSYPAGDPPQTISKYTVKVTQDCTVAILSLTACRNIFNTKLMGTKEAGESVLAFDDASEAFDRSIKLDDLKRHTILGQGTFGQVWLVSYKTADKDTPYALKVQSKYELVRDGQAQAVAYERSIMMKLRHPFILPLINTYRDRDFVYMLLGLVQGGELYTYIHRADGDGIRESSAKFYLAGIAEALGFMHRRGYVYRDLKPENILIDAAGYPIVIDFGFAKKLTDKTYTLCGTPLYLPPEVILNRGHNWSADHWSLGVLVYEMFFGDTPFYQDGMQQMDLFRSIVKGKFTIHESNNCGEKVSSNAAGIIEGFLTKDPAQRLGSLSRGEDDVLEHRWFTDPVEGKGNISINFNELRLKKIKAPVIPKIKNPLDSSNFEDWSHLEDKTRTRFPKLAADQEKLFDEF